MTQYRIIEQYQKAKEQLKIARNKRPYDAHEEPFFLILEGILNIINESFEDKYGTSIEDEIKYIELAKKELEIERDRE